MLACIVVATLQLSGCSVLAVGEETFACSGMPDSTHCQSTRKVYEETNDGSVPSPMKPKDGCTSCSNEEQAVKKGNGFAVVDDEVVNNYVTPNLPNHPVPMRTPSQVMRLWIAPFVDTKGDLIAPGYVYTEIEARKWIYKPFASGVGARTFTPLQSGKSRIQQKKSNGSENALKAYQRKAKQEI